MMSAEGLNIAALQYPEYIFDEACLEIAEDYLYISLYKWRLFYVTKIFYKCFFYLYSFWFLQIINPFIIYHIFNIINIMARKLKRIINSITVDSEQNHSTFRLSTSVSSIHPLSSSSIPSSRTATSFTLSFAHLSFEWIDKNRRPHAFSTELSMENRLEIKRLKCFEVEEIVTDYYLWEKAYAHIIQVQLDSFDIDHIKFIVRTTSRHIEAGYRWPFNGNIAKFTSKDSKDKLTRDFEPILDGRGIENLKN